MLYMCERSWSNDNSENACFHKLWRQALYNIKIKR